MKQVCMIGEGAWGTAVATLLAANGHTVKLWCHDEAVCESIKNTRHNDRYLAGVELSDLIVPTIDLEDALCDTEWIFEAIPVKFLRSVLQQVRSCLSADQRWVVLSKGIEQDTLMFPTQIIADIVGTDVSVAVFAGPSFAREVATRQITAVSLAASDVGLCKELHTLLANNFFRPYLSRDVVGVQSGAALKNVIALGLGMLQGAEYTDNTQAFFLTRGLHEMALLAESLGGKRETIYGLSGVGDLVLSAMGASGRNADVGRRFGTGQSLQQILDATGYIPEGVNTVKSVWQLVGKQKMGLPICEQIYRVIFEGRTIAQMLEHIMQLPVEDEC